VNTIGIRGPGSGAALQSAIDNLNPYSTITKFSNQHSAISNFSVRLVWWYGISMAKFTFVFDDETARTLRATAARLRKSQSLVVREAVAEYAAHAGRLTERERRRMLTTIDALRRQPASRSGDAVMAEIDAVRRARRQGGRKRPAE
jgi:predicted transcriptional regulator